MSKHTLASTNARIDAIEGRFDRLEALLAAALDAKAPAKAPKARKAPAQEEPSEFVTWLRDTAEARAERKTSNRELAAALREAGIEPNGDAWAAAKASKATTLKGKVAAARKALA